jgi:FHA domain
MSFRLFVYYCAIFGGWAAFVGWLLGALLVPRSDENLIGQMGIIAMFLGVTIAVGLGLVDALWVVPWGRVGEILLRVIVAVVIGGLGGLVGGIAGQFLYGLTGHIALLTVAWLVVGVLCGASVGSYEMLASIVSQRDRKGARAKFLKCLLGGTVGGVIGSVFFLVFRQSLIGVFSGKQEGALFSPRAIGFVAVGACIGLLVGLAQVILKEAWVRVEEGFRAGREMILNKEKTSVGRAEGSDIALFGDASVEKRHAVIVQDNGRYFVEDNGTPGGTYLNDQLVNGRTPLQSGDRIRIGKSVLRFHERQKRK